MNWLQKRRFKKALDIRACHIGHIELLFTFIKRIEKHSPEIAILPEFDDVIKTLSAMKVAALSFSHNQKDLSEKYAHLAIYNKKIQNFLRTLPRDKLDKIREEWPF